MGFKPMTLSQNTFQLMKYQRKKPIKFWLWWDSHQWLYHKIFCSLLNNTGEAYKILALMGFKPMTLSQNIFQPRKYPRKKPIKFSLWWDSNPWHYHNLFSSLSHNTGEAYKSLALMGFKPITPSQNIFQPRKYPRKKPIKFSLWWDSNPWLYHKIFSSLENIQGKSL